MAGAGVVIVGAGQAGLQAAASLRQGGYAEPIHLVGEEAVAPYQRPPLSKAYLKGELTAAQLLLRPLRFLADNAVTWLGGKRVTAIDRAGRRVSLAQGEALPYDHLILATGTRNRLLPVPGAGLPGVHYLRDLAEADALRAAIADASRVVVVGAGFIGLEFAAVARAKGLGVTVVEALERPMARALSVPMSAFFADFHRGLGVVPRFGASVARILDAGGRAGGVALADGNELAADLVLVGIGVVPSTELAAASGLAVANGIVVDEQLATADPAISAIGDCAVYPSRHAGARVRLESVQNAVDQGRAVAERLLGRGRPYAAVPWFWSDQADRKLQIAGLSGAGDAAFARGDPASGAFSVFRFAGDRLTAVESVNRAGDHMVARRLLAAGPTSRLTPDQAADESFDLKATVTAGREGA